jgi:hypothetical protein
VAHQLLRLVEVLAVITIQEVAKQGELEAQAVERQVLAA